MFSVGQAGLRMCFERIFAQHKVIIWILIVSGWFFVECSTSSNGFSSANNTDAKANNHSIIVGKIYLNITLTHSLGVINQSVVYICRWLSAGAKMDVMLNHGSIYGRVTLITLKIVLCWKKNTLNFDAQFSSLVPLTHFHHILLFF